ncbi:ChaN family lipoprotein [Rhodospirillaceae bacterium AH-315-P19]|nr:ChaN family lipoprotein [Rhodospirillaceae bacterium AH-315-P19]
MQLGSTGVALVILTAILATPVAALPKTPVAAKAACDRIGTWLDPRTGATIPPHDLFLSLVEQPVVLLGETHDNAEHHRWQLHSLAALYAHKPDLILGFEMFPRRVQTALDQWVNGKLDVAAFLKATEWRKIWGFDPALYLPLLHFARQNRIPMIALNIDHALVSRVGREGWRTIPAGDRAGLSDPAPASAAYKEVLANIFASKQARKLKDAEEPTTPTNDAADETATRAALLKATGFTRFVEAQLTWDRAMAEALVTARRDAPGSLVVGIVGQGHLRHGHGIPHQLADLGLRDGAVLLPVEPMTTCDDLAADLARAVFVVAPARHIEPEIARPRLGILIETAKSGVRITGVSANSVAERTGLAPGDLVTSAAGFPIRHAGDLIEIIQRQAPGTWLPLRITRDGASLDITAKFPTDFGTPE